MSIFVIESVENPQLREAATRCVPVADEKSTDEKLTFKN